MDVRERIARGEKEDIIVIGQLIKQGLDSDFGQVVLALIESQKSLTIQSSMADERSSDKTLGRLEGLVNLVDEFRGYIAEKERLETPLEPEAPETELASEPTGSFGGQV